MHKRRGKQGRTIFDLQKLELLQVQFFSEATGQLRFASHKVTQILLQPEWETDKMQRVKSSDGLQQKPPAPG